MSETETSIDKKNISPGALFGFVLCEELEQMRSTARQPRKATDFFFTVMLLGRIPIRFNQLTEDLVKECRQVLVTAVNNYNRPDFSLTISGIAGLLAEGLHDGFIVDWIEPDRPLCLDEQSIFDSQKRILTALQTIAIQNDLADPEMEYSR